ncbi:MAG TPA: peptide-methionine (R)-S-oxide reductase, partial [Actinobacteria bacterium]|nr:peptide-methionine (R)-S-oxide reductase [Actinomycetota bacterium]
MHELTSDNSKGQPYPVKIDESDLKNRVDELSYAVLRKAATETA